MTPTIFIDGEAGTTGLQIRERLAGRRDVTLLSLDNSRRKDPAARAEMLNRADISILCLPDEASRQAVAMVDNPDARLIDASIAYRTDSDWVYGMAEYGPDQAQRIAAAKRVTNPGCYACSAVAMVRPLVMAGIVPADFPVTLNAVSGYSGGGRKLIETFEDVASPKYTKSTFYLYALGLEHKHTEEIRVHGGLDRRPLFVPSVGRFAQGMIVSLPLQLWALPGAPGAADVHGALADHYAPASMVTLAALAETAAMDTLDPEALNGSDEMRLHVFANQDHGQVVVAALLDNLGKGASGQAVQNMNLMCGFEQTTGLKR
ncbi:MAG: N-acetyl-gamma-glutamyl-phosphate reductase [Rhodospirillales bacterium]|jgi:N-acetyl-gamma-glutamyl-phosphate reductase|nr:N-acetyl-gamma-glutamyl-phosphate reductase [Rhodospirillales bacterium]MDP6884465.1 N-acetyl-gamma-glutamyl-phosphate reductase [Rhodospirillales bacterium]